MYLRTALPLFRSAPLATTYLLCAVFWGHERISELSWFALFWLERSSTQYSEGDVDSLLSALWNQAADDKAISTKRASETVRVIRRVVWVSYSSVLKCFAWKLRPNLICMRWPDYSNRHTLGAVKSRFFSIQNFFRFKAHTFTALHNNTTLYHLNIQIAVWCVCLV